MKTYSRRRPQDQIIDNVHELCRLCLERADHRVPIFTEAENACPTLSMKITICLGLEITHDSSLPNTICLECFNILNKYYTFRKKCAVTYQRLKSHLVAVSCQKIKLEKTDQCAVVDHIEEKKEPQVNSPTEPEVAEFLTSILLELGVIHKQNEHYIRNKCHTDIQLETADGCVLNVKLFEEDQEKPRPVMEPSASEDNNVVDKEQSQDPRPQCSVCGRRFASRGAVTRHLRVHTGERPYACRADDCGRRFSQREVRARHELLHRERRPHACRLCPRSFTQRAGLAAHERSHAAPAARPLRLHACALCPKLFLHASGLSRHMRQHGGASSACGSCSLLFDDVSSLRRHQRRAHGAHTLPLPRRTPTITPHPTPAAITTAFSKDC